MNTVTGQYNKIMKQLTIAIILLFSLQAQGQLSAFTATQQVQLRAYMNRTADSIRREFKAADALLVIRLNNQNADRIALELKFNIALEQQAEINKRFDSLIIQLQADDSIMFDAKSFIVIDNKYVYLRHGDLNERVTIIESWKPSIDELIAYMDKLKRTVFINQFPQ